MIWLFQPLKKDRCSKHCSNTAKLNLTKPLTILVNISKSRHSIFASKCLPDREKLRKWGEILTGVISDLILILQQFLQTCSRTRTVPYLSQLHIVIDCISDHVLQEYLQDCSRFFVDKTGQAFNISKHVIKPNLVVSQHFYVSFCASFSSFFFLIWCVLISLKLKLVWYKSNQIKWPANQANHT